MSQSTVQGNSMNIFDRKAKKIQRERAASMDYETYNYLKDEVVNCKN